MNRYNPSIALIAALLSGCTGAAPTSNMVRPDLAAPSVREPTGTLVVGSFSSARGGIESLESSDVAGLRAAIKHMFHPKFRYTAKLTKKFLGPSNVMVIGVAHSISGAIVPLSSKEQAALLSFAKRGGAVVIFADNSDFQDADNSLLAPFGLSATGKLTGDQTATWVDFSNNPVASGPAGTSQQLDTYYPGWFNGLGSAQDIADLPGSGPAAAALLPAGTLGAQSGPVVFFSDSSLMLDGTRTKNDQIAILNALAL